MNRTQLHLSSGRGPAECAWVVAKLLVAIEAAAEADGLSINVIETTDGPEKGTFDSAVLEVAGDGSQEWANKWCGTIQWIGTSPFRPKHKRKNWFVSASLAPEVTEHDVDLSSVRIEAFRGSGPGGQHRNKVATAIRVTHIPTGIIAEASSERSQTMNRKAALEQLAERLHSLHLEAEGAASQQKWKQHDELVRGNPVKVFTGPRFVEKR